MKYNHDVLSVRRQPASLRLSFSLAGAALALMLCSGTLRAANPSFIRISTTGTHTVASGTYDYTAKPDAVEAGPGKVITVNVDSGDGSVELNSTTTSWILDAYGNYGSISGGGSITWNGNLTTHMTGSYYYLTPVEVNHGNARLEVNGNLSLDVLNNYDRNNWVLTHLVHVESEATAIFNGGVDLSGTTGNTMHDTETIGVFSYADSGNAYVSLGRDNNDSIRIHDLVANANSYADVIGIASNAYDGFTSVIDVKGSTVIENLSAVSSSGDAYAAGVDSTGSNAVINFNGDLTVRNIAASGAGTVETYSLSAWDGGVVNVNLAKNKTVQLDGDVIAYKNAATVNLNLSNAQSWLRGGVSEVGTGLVNLSLSDGGTWYVTKSSTIHAISMDGGVIAVSGSGHVTVGGAYVQDAASTLDVTLADGRTDAYLTAQSATLGGTLNISGFSGTIANVASEMDTSRYTIVDTTTGTISGNFSNITIGGSGSSTVDYVTVSGGKTADGKQYQVGMMLSWHSGTDVAHGTFTVDGAFTVDIPLAARSENCDSGWDGNSLVKSGSGTLVLSATNTFSGSTAVREGTLSLAAEDSIRSSSAMVDNGALLELGNFNQTLAALDNNGTVKFGQLGKRLTVTGNLGGNGDFHIDTDIAAGVADVIEVQGSSSGSHRLLITNSGNLPVGTESPLLLVQTSDGIATFSGTVGVGMFDYNVRNGSEIGLDTNNWYLALPGNGPGPQPAPISSAGDAILNTAAANAGFWFTQLDNLNKRMGELRYNRSADKGGWLDNVWVRSYGQQINANTGISGVKGFSETQYGIDLGTDKAWLIDDNNTIYTGVFAGYGGADRDFHRGGSDGSSDSGYGGLYGTWINKDGWYADAVAKGQYFRNSFDGEDHGAYDSTGLGLSLELGRQFQFKDGWFAEPSVQVSYVHLMNDSYTTRQGMAVDLNDADVVQFYGGARLGRNIKLAGNGWLQPYVKVGGLEQVSGGGKVRADGGEWRPTVDGARGVIGAGIVYQLNDRNQLHFDYEASFGDKYDKPWGLNFGYRHQF